ncbi:YjbH domain-containing protein [Marinobacter salinexigens]|uniref:YjbH domain-containing protein n=1 Tax=Marinobacter salinexigens TaxID=2919747 RepID=A0A5B0VKM9_9GAMM|nr:YjbH domain-containing protein [Marinobacter salinexigens]KAA1174665.1 YjbH domain-containing protein [Marinobacter salinexigens]
MTSKHWALVGGAVACLKPLSVFTGLALVSLNSNAQSAPKDLAFPGYSGFLNVPSATVLNHGQAEAQWSDQAYLQGRPGYEEARYGHFNNAIGAFGIIPYVEVGGRIVWDKTKTNCYVEDCTIRDLSANVKVQAPFIPEDWFTLAAGVQDLGGETDDFEAAYVVAGRQFGPVEVALGYGKPKETPRYLDGAFGAISYRPLPWLNIMAEHDSMDARVGLGLTSPEGWLPYGLQVKGKVLGWSEGDSDNDRNFVSLGLSMPFGNAPSKKRLRTEPPLPAEPESSMEQSSTAVKDGAETAPQAKAVAGVQGKGGQSEEAKDVALRIGQQLADEGYDRVRTSSDGETLKIQWENNLYNRDERDSILDVARMTHKAAGTHKRAELTLMNQGLPVLTQGVSLTESEPYSVSRKFAEASMLSQDEQQWDFEGGYGPSWKPRLKLSPSISSGVATEYGVWDASVALSSELSSNLWPGALVAARYDAEIYRTDDYEKGKVFYNSRQRTDLVEAEIQQTFKLHPLLYTSFHAGRYAINYNGGLNETLIFSPNGRHALGFIGGKFTHRDYDDIERTQSLAQYSYYNPGLDAQFTVYGGQFFAEDTGFRVDSRFWFGDYALTMQYKNTDAEFISLGWVIPLTPVKDHQFRYLQVKGDADWNYSVQTRINEDRNLLSSGGGAGVLTTGNPLRSVYFNRGRIGQ